MEYETKVGLLFLTLFAVIFFLGAFTGYGAKTPTVEVVERKIYVTDVQKKCNEKGGKMFYTTDDFSTIIGYKCIINKVIFNQNYE